MQSFNELINGETPVLVDFYADWCGPCKMMPPILKQVKSQHGSNLRVVKIDVDKNQALSMRYGIRSIPTVILFHKGEIAWRHTGVASAAMINTAMEKLPAAI